MFTWLIQAAMLTALTIGNADPAARVAVRKVDRVRVADSRLELLRKVPEIYATVEVNGNTVSPKRGYSMFRAPGGALLMVRGETRERELMFADSGWLQRPRPNDPNSPWVMASCNCPDLKDDECTLLKDDSGELVVVNGSLECSGPDCCEIWIYGVDGSGRTFLERG